MNFVAPEVPDCCLRCDDCIFTAAPTRFAAGIVAHVRVRHRREPRAAECRGRTAEQYAVDAARAAAAPPAAPPSDPSATRHIVVPRRHRGTSSPSLRDAL